MAEKEWGGKNGQIFTSFTLDLLIDILYGGIV